MTNTPPILPTKDSVPSAARSYESPLRGTEEIQNYLAFYLAFYLDRVTRIETVPI